MSQNVVTVIARELSLAPQHVAGALALFDEGSTLPFIARYRKEATGGLDEVQLRDVRDRAQYLRELADRRAAILESIESQGKLDDSLKARIEGAETKQALEDLYLPFKPKRRTRAMIARERGLEPLADLVWNRTHETASLTEAATAFVSAEKEVPDVDHALAGARHPRRTSGGRCHAARTDPRRHARRRHGPLEGRVRKGKRSFQISGL